MNDYHPASNSEPRFFMRKPTRTEGFNDNNPLTGVANLFDLGLVFIVGLLMAVFYAYHLEEILQQDTNLTITKQSSNGSMEIIVKKGKKIDAMRVTAEAAKGKGQRLGIAYRTADGSLIYVPDNEKVTTQRSGPQ